MLNINLAPIEEIEERLWFIADLVVVFLTYTVLSFCVDLLISNLKHDIAINKAEVASNQQQVRAMKKDIDRYDLLIVDVNRLEEKIKTIEQITVSKIKRFKTLILLEKLNNYKPDGLWFSYLEESDTDSKVQIAGGALDSLLVAKYIKNLKEDKLKSSSGIVNSIYFDKIYLGDISSDNSIYGSSGGAGSLSVKAKKSYSYFTDIKGFPIFSLDLHYKFR